MSAADFDAILGPADRVPGRAFADPAETRSDAAVMREMLVRERETARAWERERPPDASVMEHDRDGRRHWLVVPDTAALVGAHDVTAVGFFGQRREGLDHAILFDLENDVVKSFPTYAVVGLLSYYDVQLEGGRYGNLILFSTPEVPEEWHENEPHDRAVALSPRHYRSVRLHKATIPGPFLGDGELSIERTKYLDFGSDPTWRGLRLFTPVT